MKATTIIGPIYLFKQGKKPLTYTRRYNEEHILGGLKRNSQSSEAPDSD